MIRTVEFIMNRNVNDKNATVSQNPWDKVNRSAAYLTVACIPEPGNEVEETQRIVYFSKPNDGEKQIKRLDFLVGDLRIDMQILFERNCHTPSTSFSALTLPETKVDVTQTEVKLNIDTQRITQDDMVHANVNNSQLNRSSDNIAIQRDEQCRQKIIRLKQDNDELARRYSDQNQAIERLFCAIKQKNQQLSTTIDDEMNNTQNSDSRRHFTNNSSRFECQQCAQCFNLLAQAQQDNDTLKMQLKKIALSHETELQIFQRKLEESVKKNAHFVETLDIIRNLQSKLESENDKLKQEADVWRKQVATLSNQNKYDANGGQTTVNVMSLDSECAVKMPLSPRVPMTKSTIESDVLSLENQIKSCDSELTQNICDNATEQSTSQLGSSEMGRGKNHVEQMKRIFESHTGKVEGDVSLANKQPIRNANLVLNENQASISNSESQVEHEQTDSITHAIECELTENVCESSGEKISELSQHSPPNKPVEKDEIGGDTQVGFLDKSNIPIAKKINQNVDSVSVSNKTSINEKCVDECSPLDNEPIVKAKIKPSPKIERRQIDRSQCERKAQYQNKRTMSVGKSMPISNTEALHGEENMKLNKGKTSSLPKLKPADEKLRDNSPCAPLEKGKCHHTKQTKQQTLRSSGRDKLSGCQCCRKPIGPQNTAITGTKTNLMSKHTTQVPVNTSVDVNVDKSVVTNDNKWKSLRSAQCKEKSNKSIQQAANINLNAKYNRKSTKLRGAWQSANNPKPKSTVQRNKCEPKTWIPDILVRIIHEDDDRIHWKSLKKSSSLTNATDISPSTSATTSTSLYTNLCILSNEARAEKLARICQRFAEHKTIDVLTSEEMQFLDEHSTETEKLEKITPLLTQVDLERLQQIKELLPQVHVSSESLS